MIALIVVVDAIWVGFTIRGELESARDQISTGADALIHGDVHEAINAFDDARTSADAAATLNLHPSGFLAQGLPGIGDDVHAVDDLSDAASMTACGRTDPGGGRPTGGLER